MNLLPVEIDAADKEIMAVHKPAASLVGPVT